MHGLLLATTTAIPYSEGVPSAAPWWLFWLLLTTTFVLHLIPMNLVLGGSVILLVNRIRSRGDQTGYCGTLFQKGSRWLPVAVSVAITFGVAPFLFVQVLYGRFLYTSSVLLGWAWFLVIPLLILAYYGVYLLSFKGRFVEGKETVVSVFVTLLFLCIAFIYTNNMSLMLLPSTFFEAFQGATGGYSFNLTDPSLFPRYLHTLLGALSVAGISTSLYGLTFRRSDKPFADWAVRHGMIWFLATTTANVVVGSIFLMTFSRETLLQFVRIGALGSIALAAGILFGLFSLGLALVALQQNCSAPAVKGTAALLLMTLVSMVLTRDQIRSAHLAEFDLASGPVSPQWALILLFSVLFFVAIGTVGWMLVILKRSSPSG